MKKKTIGVVATSVAVAALCVTTPLQSPAGTEEVVVTVEAVAFTVEAVGFTAEAAAFMVEAMAFTVEAVGFMVGLPDFTVEAADSMEAVMALPMVAGRTLVMGGVAMH
jgi:hypothetical protein